MSRAVYLSWRGVALSVVAVAVAGCGVKRRDLDAQLQQVREEMRRGDQELASRLSTQDSRASELAARLERLERDLQALQGDFNTRIERLQGMLRFNVPVHFGYDSARVRDAARPVLDRFASVVKAHYPTAVVTVEGFTDPSGSAAYNRRLGLRRAESVREYLVTTGGLDASRVRAVSYGEVRDRQIRPGARGPGASGEENRRVVLVVDYGGGST